DLWGGCDSFGRSDFVTRRSNLRRCRLALRDFFHDLPDYQRSKHGEFRRENYRRDRSRKRDWRRNLPGWQETSERLNAVLADPLQVFREPARDWNENDFRNFVWMKQSKLVLKR